jgi:hypothetical protein
MPATITTTAGNLSIGGIGLNNTSGAWKLIGDTLAQLWLPAAQRGTDVVIPGVSGVKARPRRDTATTRSLRMLIYGDVDRTGATPANYVTGLRANIEYLRANVVAPPGTSTGTRSAVLTLPDGSTLTEDVHVVGMELGEMRLDGLWAKAVIEISIPSGRIQ